MYNFVWYFCTYPYGLTLNWWHALICIANNRHGVTITTHAIERYFLLWMTTMKQPTKRRRSYVLTLKYTFICVYWWTRQRIHNTLIVVDRYLRRMGDKTIADSAEPRLESFYPPFVAGIDLPHQGVVDSHSLVHPGVRDKPWVFEIDLSQPRHEAAFCWRHNGPVTSQLTDPFTWPKNPLQLIGIYVHINTESKESLTQCCRRLINEHCVWYFCVHIYMVWVLMDGMCYFASQIAVTASP